MKRIRCIAVIIALWPAIAAARVDAAATVAPFPVPGAGVAIDTRGDLSFEQAREQLVFQPASDFRNPGHASAFAPLVVWLRIPTETVSNPSAQYLEAATLVGVATLYYLPPGAQAYRSIDFGMHVPMRARSIARAPPTIHLPAIDPGAPVYLRLAIDEESHVVPLIRILDAPTLRDEDRATQWLASVALLFVGIFLSLAAANLFVFVFVRERAYLTYTGWMLASALFAAAYPHDSAWTWLWPSASLSEPAVLTTISYVQGLFLLAFARGFLNSSRIAPRADRILTWSCIAVLAAGAFFAYAIPSVRFGSVLAGRDLYFITIQLYLLLLFCLGLAVMLRGSKPARFFVAANVCVVLPALVLTLSNMLLHRSGTSSGAVALMVGQALEGWLLFGALAFRLREVVREFISEQQRRLVAQAELLAQTRALLEQRRAATTDALTGIANRRAFDETLTREWDRCARTQQPVSLLLCDVDYFKVYNDTYGHVLGDDCLRRVAQALVSCVKRPADLCARYGGEEFAVILAETDEAGALAVAREACDNVRALAIPHRGSSLGIVTISLGVATLVPEIGADPTIAQEADGNLYRAKDAGRNRYVASNAVDDSNDPVFRVEAARREVRYSNTRGETT